MPVAHQRDHVGGTGHGKAHRCGNNKGHGEEAPGDVRLAEQPRGQSDHGYHASVGIYPHVAHDSTNEDHDHNSGGAFALLRGIFRQQPHQAVGKGLRRSRVDEHLSKQCAFNYEQEVSKCDPVQCLNGWYCRNFHVL